jgi:hypothetical protein
MTENATATLEMPRFEFGDCDIKDDETLNAELAKTQDFDSKFFKPGKHDVVIKELKFIGLAKQDKNWGQLEVVYEGAKERTIKEYVMIPFKDVRYGANKTMYPFSRFKDFCKGLGVELSIANLGETLKTTFAKPEKLVGTPLSIDIGYKNGYVKYDGKTEANTNKYVIVLRDGNQLVSSENAPLIFPDRAAALSYANDNKLAVDEYTNVLTHQPSANGALKKADANW